MRVLVTGSTGFIGSAIVSKLDERGHSVVAYSRSEKTHRGSRKIEHIKGDVFNTVRLLEAMEKCDIVIHAVGLASVGIAQERPDESFQDNIQSLQASLEAMRNVGVPHLVLLSSSMVYGAVDKLPITENVQPKPVHIYGYHKYIAEKLAEAYSHNFNMQVTILRLFNVFGLGGSGVLRTFVEKAIRNDKVKLCGQKQRRDFIHVSDVADSIAEVLHLKHKFEIYNVGTGVGRTIEDILRIVMEYFPTLSVERVAFEGVLYNSVADITKIKNAIAFNPDTRDDRIREVIQELRRQM